MTVKAIGVMNNKFQGISSDIKPEKVEDGATYDVIDTGEKYVYHDGMWEPDLRLIRAISILQKF